MPAFLSALLFALPLSAQIRWGARVGIADGEPMVGADFVHALGAGIIFNPSIEVSSAVVSTNADFHYDIPLMREAAVWVGAGAALVNPKDEDLDVGVNVLAGIAVKRSGHIYYSQVKSTAGASSDHWTTLAVGVRF